MKYVLPIIAATCALTLSSCEYDAPLTKAPTRRVDERLLGNWKSTADDKVKIRMRRLDDQHYLLAYDAPGDKWIDQLDLLFKAHQSDVGGLPLVSLESPQRN